ncbi:hypothetical protein [Lacrimispora saccharolytica]|uniref:Uncharacterized protein n=1 Tax=Lacrimispora saccharolytica (strain ATCC 35040 / DSM 2544 / NRCC 2533 / WM1) TaxID=610130 RepID=D9RAA1_LACSW|nr:hypothetical protein [Lacrimispora saccharolytica]ADL04179.1 conserved hypothetical protein [[Clostridium] saccharolyticum WM1]QRV21536.1 hypothetical protein I6K70_08865 [Lacrimispora saccharolytica]
MKWKRLLALAGLFIILAMYVIALISAFSHSPESKNWLMAAIISSAVIPVLLYAAQLVARVLKTSKSDSDRI